MGAALPDRDPAFAAGNQWTFGEAFFRANATRLTDLVAWARLPAALLAGLAVGLTAFWAWTLWGPAAGIVAGVLLGASPVVLDHGRWVTTDMPLATFGLLAVFATWQALRRASAGWAAAAGLALGCAVATKFSGPLLGGVVILQVALWHAHGGRLPGRWVAARLLGIGLLAAYAVPACAYATPMWLPAYLDGAARVNHNHLPTELYYLLGRFYYGRDATYFAAAWLFKTPLPLALATLAGLLAAARPLRNAEEGPDRALPALFALAAAAILAAMTATAANLGVRYLLPAFPFLALLAGRAVRAPVRGARPAMLALCAGTAASGALAWPAPGDAVSLLARGDGIRYLDDSNLDWGQGLVALREQMRRRGIGRVGYGTTYLTFPDLYGIDIDRDTFMRFGRFAPGWYAFSPRFMLRAPGAYWLTVEDPAFRVEGLRVFRFDRDTRDLAERRYRALLAGRPRDAWVWMHFGWFQGQAGHMAEGLGALDRSLELWPRNLPALRLRAALRTKAGDAAGARADLEATRTLIYYLNGLRQ